MQSCGKLIPPRGSQAKQVLCEDKKIMFFTGLSAEMRRQRGLGVSSDDGHEKERQRSLNITHMENRVLSQSSRSDESMEAKTHGNPQPGTSLLQPLTNIIKRLDLEVVNPGYHCARSRILHRRLLP
ncbi:unnamed protein product [Pleuronectes platessa]|uniref:Uncharacterized protein n=1 Tax=Pleuronectes platessa TaxID=8262 RepID=A0A9N7YY81_PLEPL|nr:unnamed protein product [Pleuronectes platessa]